VCVADVGLPSEDSSVGADGCVADVGLPSEDSSVGADGCSVPAKKQGRQEQRTTEDPKDEIYHCWCGSDPKDKITTHPKDGVPVTHY
jgi:hypothetical protein